MTSTAMFRPSLDGGLPMVRSAGRLTISHLSPIPSGAFNPPDRAGDGRLVLDRLLAKGLSGSARYWLAEAEVASATGDNAGVAMALNTVEARVDSKPHARWALAISA